MGGPEMAPQFTWGPRHGPQNPRARHAPGNPGRSSVLRAGGSPLHGPRPAEWNAVVPEHTPRLLEAAPCKDRRRLLTTRLELGAVEAPVEKGGGYGGPFRGPPSSIRHRRHQAP